jgi:hypothetical protein
MEYEMPHLAIWDFYVTVPPENNGAAGAGMFRLYASFDASETNLDMNGIWRVENDDGSSHVLYVLDNGNLNVVVIPGLSRVAGHIYGP